MAHHITSFFEKRFKRDTTLTIDRSSSSYSFFINEYRNGLERDPEGNIIVIKQEREKLVKIKNYLGRLISMNSDMYGYFVNEYRQNSPVHDAEGNIILYDEIIENGRRL